MPEGIDEKLVALRLMGLERRCKNCKYHSSKESLGFSVGMCRKCSVYMGGEGGSKCKSFELKGKDND